MKSMYEKLSYALLLCIGLVYGITGSDTDTYTVDVKNSTKETIFFGFKKTSATGTVNSKQPTTTRMMPHKQIYAGATESVQADEFPAILRSKTARERATEHTTFFVSVSQSALTAVLNKTASAEQKKLVYTRTIKPKMGTACSGTLNFTVTKRNPSNIQDTRLVIAVRDNRTC